MVVYVASDDASVGAEFEAALEAAFATAEGKTLGLASWSSFARFAKDRPERTPQSNAQADAFAGLLVDLRLFSDAHVFVGTQTSNLGVVACLLRGGTACLSVESPFLEQDPANSFAWDQNEDKMT